MVTDCYSGEHGADFAETLAYETSDVPERWAPYIDFERYWNDLSCQGWHAVETGRTVHVFSPG